LKAVDKNWHPECYKCAKCEKSFDKNKAVPYEGKPYHASCLDEMTTKLCENCSQKIVGEYLAVSGKNYHKACHAKAERDAITARLTGGKQEVEKKSDLLTQAKLDSPIKPQEEQNKETQEIQVNPIIPKSNKDEKETNSVSPQKNEVSEPKIKEVENQEEAKAEVPANDKNTNIKPVALTQPTKTTEATKSPTKVQAQATVSELPNDKSPSGIILLYEEITNEAIKKKPMPEGTDVTKRETYLSYAEFKRLFGITYEDFCKFQPWKQNQQKTKMNIF